MKAKAINSFYDIQEDTQRYAGDEFECTKARFEEINEALPNWVEAVKTQRTTKAAKAKK